MIKEKYKPLLAIYAVWGFIHSYLWLTAFGDSDKFFPFSGKTEDYDGSEFFVYMGLPALLIFCLNTFFPTANKNSSQ